MIEWLLENGHIYNSNCATEGGDRGESLKPISEMSLNFDEFPAPIEGGIKNKVSIENH